MRESGQRLDLSSLQLVRLRSDHLTHIKPAAALRELLYTLLLERLIRCAPRF